MQNLKLTKRRKKSLNFKFLARETVGIKKMEKNH